MIFSKYALIKRENHTLKLYHLIKKSALCINFGLPLNKKTDEELIAMMTEEEINKLCSLGLIVKSEEEDLNDYTLSKKLYKYSEDISRFVVHLNYDCNLRCEYCYQNVIHNKCVMNEKNLFDTIKFIVNVVKDNISEMVDICLIGGEPTLHSNLVLRFMKEINQKIHLNIHYSIVTNGVFSDFDAVKEMVKLGLKEFIITVDGPKYIHDSLRFFPQKVGSYDIILSNLKKMSLWFPEVLVSINCNLNTQNINHIEDFLVDLKLNNIEYPVIYSFVIDTKEKKFKSTLKSTNTVWKDIHQLSNRYGYKFIPFYRDTFLTCSLFQKNNYTIGADGYLYACIEAVGVLEYRLAHVSAYKSPLFDYYQAMVCKTNNHYSNCCNCSFLPVCDGGCLYKKRNKDFVCPKRDFENNDVEMAFTYLFSGDKNESN